MKIDKIDPLEIANTPEFNRNELIDSFRNFATVTESFKAVYAALYMTAQLMHEDANKTINMTDEDRNALYKSYYQLLSYLEDLPEDELEEDELEEDELEEDGDYR